MEHGLGGLAFLIGAALIALLTTHARVPFLRWSFVGVLGLGGLGMLFGMFDFHTRETPPSSEDLARAYKPYIETCIAAFGPDRGMFQSNFPPDGVSSSYAVLWNAFKRLAANLSTDEKAKLFSGTAKRVYRLG